MKVLDTKTVNSELFHYVIISCALEVIYCICVVGTSCTLSKRGHLPVPSLTV